MDVMSAAHVRMLSQKDKSSPLPVAPLDLTFLTQQELERASDSPLDLSLKTRKRCADTTGHDEDIIFITQRSPEKRLCYEKKPEYSPGRCVRQYGQSNDWNTSSSKTIDRGFENNKPVYNRDIYFGNDTPKNPSRTIHHMSRDSCSTTVSHKTTAWENRHRNYATLQKFPTPAPQMGERPPSENLGRRIHVTETIGAVSTGTYSSRIPESGPSSVFHSSSFKESRTSTPRQQVFVTNHLLQMDCAHSRTVSSSYPHAVPTSVKPTSTSSVSHKGPGGLFSHPSPTGYTTCRINQPQSELRAALSSTGRYYPSQTPLSSPGVVSHIPLAQSCSPDSTFSTASTCAQPRPLPSHDSHIASANVSLNGHGEREQRKQRVVHKTVPPPTIMSNKCHSPSVMLGAIPRANSISTQNHSQQQCVSMKTLSPSLGNAITASPSTISPSKQVTSFYNQSPSNLSNASPLIAERTVSPQSRMLTKCPSSSTLSTKSLSPCVMQVTRFSPLSDYEVKGITEFCSNNPNNRMLTSENRLVSPRKQDIRKSPVVHKVTGQAQLTQTVGESAFHSVTKPETSSANDCAKFETPLHISIPFETKNQIVNSSSEKTDTAKTVVRERILTCKKHMILNAVNQDAELKMLTVSPVTKSPPTILTESASPSFEQPNSPKMPILSPQHHNPPPLASPFVNEPPPLEPTTDDELEINTVYSDASLNSDLSVNPSPLGKTFTTLQKSENFSADSSGTNHHTSNGILPTVKNLSAFVPTNRVSPGVLTSKCAWDTRLDLNPKYRSVAEEKADLKRCADLRTDRDLPTRKVIPVANVAPMVKETFKPTREDLKDTMLQETQVLSFGKTFDLQAEIAAYKTSLRMPAKLISKSQSQEEKRTGIAEEFGASKGRFRHLEARGEVSNLRATYGKLFGAKGISKFKKPLPTVTQTKDVTDIECSSDLCDRNVFESLTMQNISKQTPVCELKTEVTVLETTAPISESSIVSDRQSPSITVPALSERLSPNEALKRMRGTSRFKFRRIDGKLKAEIRTDSLGKSSGQSRDLNHKRQRRSMLDEIANSEGYVADSRRQNNSLKGDLFADPALLTREERALQKAMLRFTEMETGTLKSGNKPKRHSNTRQRANQLKRKAIRQSPSKQDSRSGSGTPKSSPHKKGFVDFQPKVLPSRTRMQSKGIHSVGGYNRDAAYEKELVNDDRRRELKRARRMAKQMANQRAIARKNRREQTAKERDKNFDKTPANYHLKEEVSPKKPQHKKTPTRGGKSVKEFHEKRSAEVECNDVVKEEPLSVSDMSPSRLKAQLALDHLDELPDLISETKTMDLNGCWEIKDMANPQTLRQTLRSGRKKGGILMKLSWRPLTAATKGKPRIAHARVSRKHDSCPKSVRMLRLRRRAQVAFFQATKLEKRKRDKVSKTRQSRPRQLRVPQDKAQQRQVIMTRRKESAVLDFCERKTRLRMRRKQAGARRETRRSHTSKRVTPPAPVTPQARYPLRDLINKIEEDGYTTEEYEFEPGHPVYSEDDDSVYDDQMETESNLLGPAHFSEFPEPPELRKLNVNKNSGETVLHRAARLGYEEVALYCLHTQFVDVNARDNAGYTPLHEACVGGQSEIVRHLLGYEANPNACTQDGVRPIQYPLQNHNTELVRLMLSYGADPLLDSTVNVSPDIISLINRYHGDINGYAVPKDEVPWSFYGSSVIEKQNGVEHNLFSNIPSDEEEEDIDDMFELSDVHQFVSYRLKVPEAESDDNYVILALILDKYKMSRAAFLRELGPVVRIYSLSRSMLEEEIMHASSICCPLAETVKQSQTVEIIRLSDVPVVQSHKTNPTKGKGCVTKQPTGSRSSSGKFKATRTLLEPDLEYPHGLLPREFSRTLDDLRSLDSFESPSQRHKGLNGSSKLSSALKKCETYPSQESTGLFGDLDQRSFTKDTGSRGVLPELLNSSERFLKLNESSTGKLISEKSQLTFSLDMESSTTLTPTCKPNSLDAKHNSNASKNTQSLGDHISRIDR